MYESNPVTALNTGIHPPHFPLPRNTFRQTLTRSKKKKHIYFCRFILKGAPGSTGAGHVQLDAVGGGVTAVMGGKQRSTQELPADVHVAHICSNPRVSAEKGPSRGREEVSGGLF